jgi:hypothetical protein
LIAERYQEDYILADIQRKAMDNAKPAESNSILEFATKPVVIGGVALLVAVGLSVLKAKALL